MIWYSQRLYFLPLGISNHYINISNGKYLHYANLIKMICICSYDVNKHLYQVSSSKKNIICFGPRRAADLPTSITICGYNSGGFILQKLDKHLKVSNLGLKLFYQLALHFKWVDNLTNS